MFFEKKDVSLYYEVQGEGTPMLMIHGASVDAGLYENAAKALAKYYKVIIYDRRGSSRSTAAEDASYNLDTQVNDAKDLLEYLGIKKAILVGASAGAILAHRFLMLYPEMVEKILLYEPAILTLLEGTEHSKREWVDKMEDLIARNKINTAMFEFVQSIGELDTRAPEKSPEQSMREMRNLYSFLPKEYETFIEYRPDMEKSKELADKIIVAVGDSSKDAPYATAAKVFASGIGKKALYYPGYHNAPYDLPTEFAICVLGTLML